MTVKDLQDKILGAAFTKFIIIDMKTRLHDLKIYRCDEIPEEVLNRNVDTIELVGANSIRFYID